MKAIQTELETLLKKHKPFVADGKLMKNKVIEFALKLDKDLLKLLKDNISVKNHFFQDVDGVLVFDKVKFQDFVNLKSFLADSYTKYKSKIGFESDGDYLSKSKDVVLVWPYKDCLLEGGQTKAERENRSEIFWNETLAPEHYDRLLSPKAFTNFKKYDNKGEQNLKDKIDFGKENLFIKGNNLLALYSLKERYEGKVKLIYIDPPYNTEKDTFNYNDSFKHTTWLTFMKNRLEVAQELLKEEGIIFISIDDGEQAYLKILCDEIFKRENYLGVIIWETATDNNPTQISIEHEYVIAYAKNKNIQEIWQIKSDKAKHIQEQYEKLKEQYKKDTDTIEKELRKWINSVKKSNDIDLSGVSHYSYVDVIGVFYPGNSANTIPGGYTFDIIHPNTKKVCKKPEYGYRWPAETFWKADKKGDVLWGKDEKSIPKIKKRLDSATELLKGYFYEDNRKSTKELTKLMGEKVFNNPKSVNLLKKIISFTTSENDIILDFFAGSGTTAEAILKVNEKDNGKRKFILCEQLDYVNTVSIQRIQKVIGKGNFVFFELAKDNAQYIDKIEKAKKTEELKKIWKEMQVDGFISHRIKETEVFSNSGEMKWKSLSFDEQKQILIRTLDLNHLYINYSEIKDTKYKNSFTPNDISINQSFYK